MQPIGSMAPGQLIMPSPQSVGGILGQWKGHWSPSATQESGIMQPMGSMSPGQGVIPSPQSMGAIGGQGAGTARAVERRVKIRRDISRLTLLDNSVFLPPPDWNLYPQATCDLFAPLIVTSVLAFICHLSIFTGHTESGYRFSSPLVLDDLPFSVKLKSL